MTIRYYYDDATITLLCCDYDMALRNYYYYNVKRGYRLGSVLVNCLRLILPTLHPTNIA